MWYSDARAGKRMSMLEALLLTNYRRSSEEQDKVFSLLGLVDAGGIEPDYNLHPADVYRRTVQRIVEMEESLEVLSAVRELRTEPLFERIEEESRKYRHEWKDFTSSGGPLDDTAQDADIIIHPPAVDTSSGRPRSEMDSGGDLLSSWSFQPGYQDRSRRPIYTESKTRPQDKIVPFGASGTSKPEVRFLGAVMELDGVVLSRVRPGPHSGANGSEIRYLNSKRSGTPLCDHEKMLEQACRPLWEHFIAHGAIWQHGLQTWRSVYGSPFDTLRAFQNTLLLGQEGPQTGDDTQFDVDLDRRFLWTGVTGLHPDELKNIEPSLPSHELLHTMFQRTLDTRSFFVTQNGYMGFASMEVAAGDVVCLLKGGPTPYILRPYDATGGDGHFYFVCDCCKFKLPSSGATCDDRSLTSCVQDVHGIMRGEAWSKYADGTVPLQTIRII